MDLKGDNVITKKNDNFIDATRVCI